MHRERGEKSRKEKDIERARKKVGKKTDKKGEEKKKKKEVKKERKGKEKERKKQRDRDRESNTLPKPTRHTLPVMIRVVCAWWALVKCIFLR